MFDLKKEEIEEIAEEHPSHITIKIKSRDRELYDYVNENFEGDKFTEKLYLYLYGKEEQECIRSKCENKCSFLSFTRGFTEVCSKSCAAKKDGSKEIIECLNCETELEVYKSSEKKFCSHKCYVNYNEKTGGFDERLEKGRKRIVEKYGAMGWGSDEIKNRAMKTKIEKYGHRGYNNRKKSRQTKIKRHGDPNYNNREKARKTCLTKYGDPNYNNHEQAVKTRKKSKYDRICKSSEYAHVEPLFSEDEYDGIGYFDRYEFKCVECDEEFDDYLYKGNVPRCPNCWDGWNHTGTSEMETEIYKFLKSAYDGEIIRNDRSVLKSKELDFYIPEKDTAIEFNGIYWHGETNGKTRNYHLNKTCECEEQGIQLIHVFEDEWVYKKKIVRRRLKHILGVSDQKPVYARNCQVKEIETDQKTEFLERYHIDGAGRSSVKLGLFNGKFFNSDLIAVMTFGTPSVAQGHRDTDGVWEMKRFALSKPVVGAAGKLFKHFIRNWDPETVITYADRRWSSSLDTVYEKIGFERDGTSNPNYFYFRDGIKRKHRFNFRKSELDEKLESFDPDLTEWENMQINGYDRIWDCGHLKFKWENETDSV